VSWPARAGVALLVFVAAFTAFAPVLAPNQPGDQFSDRAYAPPMRIHVRDAGGFHRPFVYAQIQDDRISRRFHEDTSRRIPLAWFTRGSLVSVDSSAGPLLLLGGDALGRDVFSRLVLGARLSLGVTLAGVLGALVIGTIAGALAGSFGGVAESLLMLAADFLIVLPGAYLVLVLRSLLSPTLTTPQVFVMMSLLFAVAAWPHVARGVRAIVAAERTRAYADAARAAGAGPWRLARHLVPASWGFLAVEVGLLIPALLVSEATLSYLTLGFPEPKPSWGTMLQDAANVTVIGEAPWLLAPAVALFLVVLGVQLVGRTKTASALLAERR